MGKDSKFAGTVRVHGDYVSLLTIVDDLETQSSSLIRYPFFQPPLTSSTTKEGTDRSDKIIVRYGDTVLEFPETTEVGTIASLIKELSR